MLLDLNDKLSFGKYKGKTISEIIDLDFMYLYWATGNIKWFAITTKAQDKLPPKQKIVCDYSDEYSFFIHDDEHF